MPVFEGLSVGHPNLLELRDFNDSELAAALVEKTKMSRSAADRALQASTRTRTSFERTVLELGLVSEHNLYETLSGWLELPLLPLGQFDPGLILSFDLDRAYLERVEAVPFYEDENGSIIIATSNPRGLDALRSISFHLGVECLPALAERSTIKAALAQVFETKSGAEEAGQGADVDIARLEALANDGPIIGQVNDLISEAVEARASDIHIETLEASARIRLRVDGELRLHRKLSHTDCATYISRLKIMGRLRMAALKSQ
jgi:general secretion pathway protein E